MVFRSSLCSFSGSNLVELKTKGSSDAPLKLLYMPDSGFFYPYKLLTKQHIILPGVSG